MIVIAYHFITIRLRSTYKTFFYFLTREFEINKYIYIYIYICLKILYLSLPLYMVKGETTLRSPFRKGSQG